MTRAGARARAWPYAAVAAVAAVRASRAARSPGHPLYFRDLSLYFFPLRRFVLAGLRAGDAALLEPVRARGRAAAPCLPSPIPSTCCSSCADEVRDLVRPRAARPAGRALDDGAWPARACGSRATAAAAAAARLRAGRVRAFDGQPLRLRAGPGLGAGGDPRPAARRPGRPPRGRALGASRVGVLLPPPGPRSWPRRSSIGVLLALPCPARRSRADGGRDRAGRGAGRADRGGAGAGRRRQRAGGRLRPPRSSSRIRSIPSPSPRS